MLGRDRDDTDDRTGSDGGQRAGRARGAALAERVSTLSASAASPDRTVRVTVDSWGAVVGLELTDGVRHLTPVQLSEEILLVMRRAQTGLAGRVTEAVEELVGTDSPAGRAVVESFAGRFPQARGGRPSTPVMPSPPPFPSFESRPMLPHQAARGALGGQRNAGA